MEAFAQRLPVFMLIDCSEAGIGGQSKAVFDGLRRLLSGCKNNPLMLEIAWFSKIAFSVDAELVTSLAPLLDDVTGLMDFDPPVLPLGPGRCLAASLDLLDARIAQEVRPSGWAPKGDYEPVVCLLIDGPPTDAWREALARYKASTAQLVRLFIAIGFGGSVDVSMLREMTPTAFLANELSGQFERLLSRYCCLTSSGWRTD